MDIKNFQKNDEAEKPDLQEGKAVRTLEWALREAKESESEIDSPVPSQVHQ